MGEKKWAKVLILKNSMQHRHCNLITSDYLYYINDDDEVNGVRAARQRLCVLYKRGI